MTLAALGLCATSIYAFFLLWALLQERLTTTPYVSSGAAVSATLLPNQQQQGNQPEYFKSPLLLSWVQAIFSTVVAAVYLLGVSGTKGASGAGVWDRLGLGALTRDGAERIRKVAGGTRSQVTNGTNGHSLSEKASLDAAANQQQASRSWLSPLLLRYLLISALQSCSSQLGLHSLSHGISYPTLTLAKSCKLVPVLIMNVILYRRKFPAYKYLVVSLVTIGISLFMLFSAESEKKRSKGGGKGDSFIGIALLALNLLFDGATNSTQDEVFHKYTVSGPQMMLVMNALSSILMGASLVFPLHSIPLIGAALSSSASSSSSTGQSSELSTALAFISRHPEVVRDLLLYATAGAIGQVAIFETLQRFGSLTLVSITVTRKLFTMLLSLVVYSHHLTPMQWAGVLLVFFGLGIEAREKRREGMVKRVLAQKEAQEQLREDRKAKVKDA